MKVNGEERHLENAGTLEDLLLQLGYRLDRIAVEHNKSIVSKENYSKVVLQEEDMLEIVQFVGGG